MIQKVLQRRPLGASFFALESFESVNNSFMIVPFRLKTSFTINNNLFVVLCRALWKAEVLNIRQLNPSSYPCSTA